MRRLVTAPSGARVDTEAVFDAARAVGNHAEVHSGAGAEVTMSWFRVADGYSAPETQQLLGSIEPVRTASESFSTAAQAVARALTTFAIEAEAAEARRARAATSIASFRTVAKGDDSWQQDPVLVAQNSVLTSEVAAAEQELCEAEEACARAIASIPADAPALAMSAATANGTAMDAGGWVYPDEVSEVVLNPFFFWGMKPEEVTTWWDSISPESQAIFAAFFPVVIGSRDGIPAGVRDEANRLRLSRMRDQLLEEEEYWAAQNDGISEFIFNGTRHDGQAVRVRDKRWDQGAHDKWLEATDRVNALLAIEAVLRREDEDGAVGRYLLVADFSGPMPKAAVSLGNPDEAAHVGVLVAGTTTTVAGTLESIDRDAESLRTEALDHRSDLGEEVAVVSWLDYDAPSKIVPDAASRSYSRAGAPDLARFTRGLDATNQSTNGRDSDPHITVMGHSYGAVVVGDATAIGGTGVDDVVVYGAPGVGESPAPGIGRYSMLTDDDPIKHYHNNLAFGTLGEVPYDRQIPMRNAPSYIKKSDGWEQLSVEGGGGLEGSSGHSEYLVDQTRSQYNLANIIVGHPERVALSGDGK